MAIRSIAAAVFVKGLWAAQPHADASCPGEACQDAAALLQLHMSTPSWQLSGHVTWRVAHDDWRGQNCNQVCEAYGMGCDDNAFADVTSYDSMEDAVKMATGQGCPGSVAHASEAASYGFAPYFDADVKFECHYASTMYHPKCANDPLQWAKRLCPCTRQAPAGGPQGPWSPGTQGPTHQGSQGPGWGPSEPTCVQHTGTFCGNTDLHCDCNWCDDFLRDDRCANACRVMNGYTVSPFPSARWKAHRNRRPSDVFNPIQASCAWMGDNGGLGDDCARCDQYAYQCRVHNKFGTCG